MFDDKHVLGSYSAMGMFSFEGANDIMETSVERTQTIFGETTCCSCFNQQLL